MEFPSRLSLTQALCPRLCLAQSDTGPGPSVLLLLMLNGPADCAGSHYLTQWNTSAVFPKCQGLGNSAILNIKAEFRSSQSQMLGKYLLQRPNGPRPRFGMQACFMVLRFQH